MVALPDVSEPGAERRSLLRVAGVVALLNGWALVSAALVVRTSLAEDEFASLLLIGFQAALLGGIGIAAALPPGRQLPRWNPTVARIGAWWSLASTTAIVSFLALGRPEIRAFDQLPWLLGEIARLGLLAFFAGGLQILSIGNFLTVGYLVIGGLERLGRRLKAWRTG